MPKEAVLPKGCRLLIHEEKCQRRALTCPQDAAFRQLMDNYPAGFLASLSCADARAADRLEPTGPAERDPVSPRASLCRQPLPCGLPALVHGRAFRSLGRDFRLARDRRPGAAGTGPHGRQEGAHPLGRSTPATSGHGRTPVSMSSGRPAARRSWSTSPPGTGTRPSTAPKA